MSPITLGPDPLRDHMTKACDPRTCAFCKKHRRIEDVKAGKPPLDPICDSCVEGWGEPDECPLSRRQCGHHCNCLGYNDHCHWCDAEHDEDGNVVMPSNGREASDGR